MGQQCWQPTCFVLAHDAFELIDLADVVLTRGDMLVVIQWASTCALLRQVLLLCKGIHVLSCRLWCSYWVILYLHARPVALWPPQCSGCIVSLLLAELSQSTACEQANAVCFLYKTQLIHVSCTLSSPGLW